MPALFPRFTTRLLNVLIAQPMLMALLMALVMAPAHASWTFKSVADEARVDYIHQIKPTAEANFENVSGGVAAGDYNRDGHVDLYLVTGDMHPNRLLRNNGDGTFADVTPAAGAPLALDGHLSSAPVFADINGDGWLDLYVGGIRGWGHYVFLNQADGTFSDATQKSGIYWEEDEQNEYSAAFGDPDRDGDLDLFVTHWGARGDINHYWRNDGSGTFHASDILTGYQVRDRDDYTFSPTFADINNDGWQDLLVVADFLQTQVFINESGQSWQDVTDPEVLTDESGMGSAVADFDNDGDLDWFVTAIHRPDHTAADQVGSTGNRMYINDGNGAFSDGTDAAGVRKGGWGWGACAADFNNDGWLDIFHVNGMPLKLDAVDFTVDTSVMFINQGNGVFSDQTEQVGIAQNAQGRGLVCFDYDGDGDIDIFTQNWNGTAELHRNDLDEPVNWLQLELIGEASNPLAIGARIEVTAGDKTQLRELTIGSNFASNNPLLQHFGLGSSATIDRIEVSWPHGGKTVLEQVQANQKLQISATQATPPPFAMEAGMSSAWYDTDRNGEGFLLEVLANNVAVLYWFTYNDEGEQDWYVAVGNIQGRRILFAELIRVSGGAFGDGFDPAKIERTPVGSAAFTWDGCESAFMDWYIGDRHGRQGLTRLAPLDGLGCGLPKGTTSQPQGQFSGSWFDPSHDGEGFIVEMLATGQPLVYWFSYSPEGHRRWYFGVGEVRDGKLAIDEMFTTDGARFGAEFNPDEVHVKPWGSLELDLNCSEGTASYSSIEPGFGSGSQNLVRLTTLDGLSCP